MDVARFDKLEFDDAEETATGHSMSELANVEKDERYWLEMAETQRRNGHHENALRFYSRSLEFDKSLVIAWVGQVQMLILLGEYPQACTWSKKALELFPNNLDLLAAQSQAECRIGDFKKSNALIDGALHQRGESAYQWQVRAELMVAQKQKTDRYCFDKAQIASTDSLVPLETALIYLHYQEYAKAQQRIGLVLEKQADSYYAWYLLGWCQEKLGLTQAAIRSYCQCAELCPNHHESLMRLAQLRSGGWNIADLFRRIFRRS